MTLSNYNGLTRGKCQYVEKSVQWDEYSLGRSVTMVQNEDVKCHDLKGLWKSRLADDSIMMQIE